MTLNIKQKLASDMIKSGKNVLIDSPGGYGKTYTINTAKSKNSITVCPTGASALLAGGSTYHKVLGVKPGVIKPDDYKKKLKPNLEKVLAKTPQLILDEWLFTRFDMTRHLDYSLRNIMGNNQLFGGKQVVASTDAFQLLGFVTGNERAIYNSFYGDKVLPIAHTELMESFERITLEEPVRNTNLDQVELLSAIRTKSVGWQSALQDIINMATPYDPEEDITHICSYNKHVDSFNKQQYAKLQGKEQSYHAEYTGNLKTIQEQVKAPVQLKLKIGTRVRTIVNNEDAGYVNGSTGVVMDMHPDCVYVKLDTGDIVLVTYHKFEVKKYQFTEKRGMYQKKEGEFNQLPLVHSYAMSGHATQGCTLPKAVINTGGNCFAEGLFYMMISRVPDLRELRFAVTPTTRDVRVNNHVKRYFV